MATTTLQRTNQAPNLKPVFICLILVMFATGIVYSSHAFENHGSDANAVRKCIENRGASEIWFNPITNRHAHVCQLDNGKFGIQITTEKLREITSFVKNKMQRIDQVRQYLSNRGYIPVQ